MQMILAIAAGGAIGAVCRHGINSIGQIGGFPLSTFIVNVVGSLLMGVCIGVFAHVWQPEQALKAFITVGFLGAFTTFSTFSMDAVLLYERGQLLLSAAYIASSVVISIAGLFLGLMIIRQVFSA